VEDLRENTINDILLVIEKVKKEKEDLEYSVESRTIELNNIKNELNKTKKSNLSFSVDNQNMEMIQNVLIFFET
jgi:transposase